MLLLFLFVLLLFFVFFFSFSCYFFRDRDMIFIGTVEFRYYVAIIIPVNVGKP